MAIELSTTGSRGVVADVVPSTLAPDGVDVTFDSDHAGLSIYSFDQVQASRLVTMIEAVLAAATR